MADYATVDNSLQCVLRKHVRPMRISIFFLQNGGNNVVFEELINNITSVSHVIAFLYGYDTHSVEGEDSCLSQN